MLVVIGIIVTLLSILIPSVAAMRRAAEKKAIQADLNTIGTALDAYKSDFGDYPRPPLNNLNYRMLAWGLIGAAEVPDPFGATPTDGNTGPGFRTAIGGKVWGPYISPDKFKPTTGTDPYRWDLFDRYGQPIEYFPRWRVLPRPTGAATLTLFGTNTVAMPLSTGTPPTPVKTVYDYHQAWYDPKTASGPTPKATGQTDRHPLNYLRKALGDTNMDDLLTSSEAQNDLPPFILMSRGPLQKYSTYEDVDKKFSKCREITNLNVQ
jgi:type II secretory pathway pseudopilin PulG